MDRRRERESRKDFFWVTGEGISGGGGFGIDVAGIGWAFVGSGPLVDEGGGCSGIRNVELGSTSSGVRLRMGAGGGSATATFIWTTIPRRYVGDSVTLMRGGLAWSLDQEPC